MFKFRGRLDLSHLDVFVFLVMYFYTTYCVQCVIQVWGYGKTICPLVCLFNFSVCLVVFLF